MLVAFGVGYFLLSEAMAVTSAATLSIGRYLFLLSEDIEKF